MHLLTLCIQYTLFALLLNHISPKVSIYFFIIYDEQTRYDSIKEEILFKKSTNPRSG